MFISIKTTSPHKDILRAEGTGNSHTNFFCVPSRDFWCTTVVKKRANIFSNHEPNRVPKISLNYLQNVPIYFPSGKHKRLFLKYCYAIIFVHGISCP